MNDLKVYEVHYRAKTTNSSYVKAHTAKEAKKIFDEHVSKYGFFFSDDVMCDDITSYKVEIAEDFEQDQFSDEGIGICTEQNWCSL